MSSSRGILSLCFKHEAGFTNVALPRQTTSQRAYKLSLTASIWATAFAMTLPGMINAYCAPTNSSPSQVIETAKNMSTLLQMSAVFLAVNSSFINSLVNASFLPLVRSKLSDSLKPIRTELEKSWSTFDGRTFGIESAKLTAYLTLATFAGFAMGAISWDAFSEIPEPWGIRASIFFGSLNALNAFVSRFTGLPGLVDSVQKRYNAIKKDGISKEDVTSISLAGLAAICVFPMFTQSGFKGIRIVASKLTRDANALTDLPSWLKIAIGAPAGLISSAFYANHALNFIKVANYPGDLDEKTHRLKNVGAWQHIKQHKWETAPMFVLAVLCIFTGALLGNVNENIIKNDDATNPNGNIFGISGILGHLITALIFLFASAVNMKIIVSEHTKTEPQLMRVASRVLLWEANATPTDLPEIDDMLDDDTEEDQNDINERTATLGFGGV